MPKAKTIKIVDVEQPQETQPDEQPAEEVTPEVEEVKETPKAKSKARAKKKVIDETITVAKNVVLDFDTKDEPTIKAIQKVECPNCNKMVSAKTFKYSHVHTCKAKKEVVEKPVAIEQPPDIEVPMIQTRPAILSSREARLQKRQEHLNQLIKQAF
jgi:ribosomal protein S8